MNAIAADKAQSFRCGVADEHEGVPVIAALRCVRGLPEDLHACRRTRVLYRMQYHHRCTIPTMHAGLRPPGLQTGMHLIKSSQ